MICVRASMERMIPFPHEFQSMHCGSAMSCCVFCLVAGRLLETRYFQVFQHEHLDTRLSLQVFVSGFKQQTACQQDMVRLNALHKRRLQKQTERSLRVHGWEVGTK